MSEAKLPEKLRWYQGLTRYQWWVLAIAVFAWMFDCIDQRLFVLSRAPAVKELLGYEDFKQEALPEIRAEAEREVAEDVAAGKLAEAGREAALNAKVEEKLGAAFRNKAADFGNIVTALTVIGWSVGGFGFGIYGDRLGRVRTRFRLWATSADRASPGSSSRPTWTPICSACWKRPSPAGGSCS